MSPKHHFASAVDEMNALQERIADPGGLRTMQRQFDQIAGGSLRRVLADQKRLADLAGMTKMFAAEERLLDPSGMARMSAKEQLLARRLEHSKLAADLRSDLDKIAGTDLKTLRADRIALNGAALTAVYKDALACDATALASATKPFVDIREQLAVMSSADIALKWEHLATITLGSTLHDLFRFDRATAVMALDRDAALGSLAWVEDARDEDDDAPRVKVVALHAHRPARPDPVPQLKFEPGSGFNCKRCGEHIPLDFSVWITKSPDTAFLQGTIDVAVQCPNCGDQPLYNDDDDFTLEALHEIVRGEEDDVPESGVYRIKKKGEE